MTDPARFERATSIVPAVTTQGVPSTPSSSAHQFGQDWRAGINHDYVESKLLKGEWVTSDDYECRAVPLSQLNAVNGETISINGKLNEIECRLK